MGDDFPTEIKSVVADPTAGEFSSKKAELLARM